MRGALFSRTQSYHPLLPFCNNHDGGSSLLLSALHTPKVARLVISQSGCELSAYSIVCICGRYIAAGRAKYKFQCSLHGIAKHIISQALV
jgi:hypothetical protein